MGACGAYVAAESIASGSTLRHQKEEVLCCVSLVKPTQTSERHLRTGTRGVALSLVKPDERAAPAHGAAGCVVAAAALGSARAEETTQKRLRNDWQLLQQTGFAANRFCSKLVLQQTGFAHVSAAKVTPKAERAMG